MSKEKEKTTTKNDLIDTMSEWFAKFPALPKKGKEVLVKFAPVISIVFGILGIIVAISGLGLLTATSPFAFLGGSQLVSSYGSGFLAILIYLVSSILLLVAFPGLKGRKIGGWNLLFWSEVVSLVGGLVSLSILSAVIGALIGFYLLFQIKSYYK